MAFRAIREIKIRGVVYQPGDLIPGIATYYGLRTLIRRGRVEEFEPSVVNKGTQVKSPVTTKPTTNGKPKVSPKQPVKAAQATAKQKASK